MNLVELMRARAGLIESARALLDKAETEKRDLTAAERAAFDEALAKIEAASEAIKRGNPAYARAFPARGGADAAAWVRELAERLEQPVGEPIKPAAPGGLLRALNAPADGGLSFADEHGREVRALTARERFSDARRSAWPGWIEQPDELRVGRWIRGLVTGDWREAEAERRAMATFDDTLGGYLLPEPLGAEVIDLARADSVLMAAGALTVPMTSKTLLLARVTSDPTPTWKQENAKLTATGLTFGGLELVAKMLMAIIPISLELVTDAPNAASVIESAMRAALSLELDRVGLFGSGAGEEPRGLYHTPGLGAVNMGAPGVDGAQLTDFAPFVAAIRAVREANGRPTAAIYSPRTAETIDALTDLNHQPLQPPRAVADLAQHVSTQVPNDLVHGAAVDASIAFVGDFSNVLYGLRESVRVEVSRDAGEAFERGQVLIRVHLRADVAVRRAAQLCAIRGIIPAP